MIRILSPNEKKQILGSLNKQFGIKSIQGIFLQSGTERIFLYQGSLTEKQIKDLEESRINIERIGIYFAKEQGAEIRLSIEGIHLLKDQITKKVFNLDEKQLDEWMHGNEILFDDVDEKVNDKDKLKRSDNGVGGRGSGGLKEKPRGFIIMKHKNDFVGCGKASENKITNFIPKSRRLKG